MALAVVCPLLPLLVGGATEVVVIILIRRRGGRLDSNYSSTVRSWSHSPSFFLNGYITVLIELQGCNNVLKVSEMERSEDETKHQNIQSYRAANQVEIHNTA